VFAAEAAVDMSHSSRPNILDGPKWLSALRAYFAAIMLGNVVWESLQLPLYAIWREGSPREIVFALAHCTAGDLMIAAGALLASLLLLGSEDWPRTSFVAVALAAIALGVAYTGFSEWLNVSVRKSWAYSELMPVVPLAGGVGVSPLLQWLVVPAASFWCARRASQ
jgi:hypothetical protein